MMIPFILNIFCLSNFPLSSLSTVLSPATAMLGKTIHQLVQLAGGAEYTNCISAKCPGYDTKQSDGVALGMQSTPSLPLLPGSLWPGVVASDRVLSMNQIELNCILMLN